MADAYLFTIMRCEKKFEVAMPGSLLKYFDPVATHPKVQEALKAEGLA